MGSSAQAADFTVTSLADNGSPGTLRTAIGDANGTPSIADRILFQSGLSGTITLTGSYPKLVGSTEIVGPGASQLKIDGDGDFRVAYADTTSLSVSGLTISNTYDSVGGGAVAGKNSTVTVQGVKFDNNKSGATGGAVLTNGGSLSIKDSEFTANAATDAGGAVSAASPTLTIIDSSFTGNQTGPTSSFGGAVVVFAYGGSTTAIADSEFSGNSSDMGGAIFTGNGGTVSIDSSTFTGNTAATFGGAVRIKSAEAVSISNSTITGNRATASVGGLLTFGPNVKVESSTITGNTADLPNTLDTRGAGFAHGEGTAQVSNSIIWGNTPEDISTVDAATIQGSFDLIGSKNNAAFTESVAGSNIPAADPQLGVLADNGGTVRTMLPADTSPVVNKGSSSLTIDQRGLTRPIDFAAIPFSKAPGANGADIGAVELQYTPPSNAFSFGKIKLNRKKGVATLQVKVPGAGKVLLKGSKTVAKSSKTAKGKATIKLSVKAKGKAARTLKKKGKVKVKASVKFSPTGGAARTKSTSVKLVKKKNKKKKK